MLTDKQLIAETYIKQIVEAQATTIRRIDKGTVEVDGEQKDITNWMYEITDGGRSMCSVWAIRRRDKKVGGQIIARAGDVFKVNGKLGACKKEITGAGSPLGGPKERYSKYGLVTMCVEREGEFHTRHIAADSIQKIIVGNVSYHITSPEKLTNMI